MLGAGRRGGAATAVRRRFARFTISSTWSHAPDPGYSGWFLDVDTGLAAEVEQILAFERSIRVPRE